MTGGYSRTPEYVDMNMNIDFYWSYDRFFGSGDADGLDRIGHDDDGG